jgi:hypothetical protein
LGPAWEIVAGLVYDMYLARKGVDDFSRTIAINVSRYRLGSNVRAGNATITQERRSESAHKERIEIELSRDALHGTV